MAPHANRLSVVVLLLAFAGSLATSAGAAPMPRPGLYYGSENGTVVEFTLARSHGVIKGHYVGLAPSFPSSNPSGCLALSSGARFLNSGHFMFRVRKGRITDLHFPNRAEVLGFGGSFNGRSKASGKYVVVIPEGRCATGWTAERVSRPILAKSGTWAGAGDGLRVTFKISARRIASDFKFTNAKPIGSCSGPFGLGESWFVPPHGSSFTGAGEAEGAGWGFDARLSSATSATGSFTGSGECQSAAMAWNAQPSG